MLDSQIQQIIEAAGVANGPAVGRYYRDGDHSQPRIVIHRDIQGCRIMQRAEGDSETWSCAWFDEAGSLIVAERFCCGRQQLDPDQTEQLLNRLLSQPFKGMARELIPLVQLERV